MSFVLDASIALAWLFEDESDAQSDRALSRLTMDEALVPDLWTLEVANVLLAAERRKRVTETQTRRFLTLLAELSIRVNGAKRDAVWGGVLPLAREQGLSVYDAAYLDLAMSEGVPLATRDRALAEAADRVGVTRL